LSEHNARMTLAIADRAYVIETGNIALQGSGRELLGRSDIVERYLGIVADSTSANRRNSEDRHVRFVRGLAKIFDACERACRLLAQCALAAMSAIWSRLAESRRVAVISED